MKHTLLISLLLTTTFFSVSAQKYTVDTVFFDRTGEVIKGAATDFTTFEIRALDKKGKIQGTAVRFTKAGRAVESTDYVKGKKNGIYERYNPLGNVMISGEYMDDLQIGTWATMNMEGKIVEVINYGRDGKKKEVYNEFNWADTGAKVGEPMSSDDVEIVITKQASYPGGMQAWANFLRNNLSYPTEAKRYGHEGAVFISFSVLKNGLVVKPMIAQSPHPSLSREALRVIKKSGKWNPAETNGEPIDSQMQIRIVFRLKTASISRGRLRTNN